MISPVHSVRDSKGHLWETLGYLADDIIASQTLRIYQTFLTPPEETVTDLFTYGSRI
jgi:hypothetical protein